MNRYRPSPLNETGLPHTESNMFEPMPITATSMFTFVQKECTYSGYSDTELEEETGLTYFHDTRVEIDRQADALMQGIYKQCSNFYYCYAVDEYIGVAPLTDEIAAEFLREENIQLQRPHYAAYQRQQTHA